MSFKDQVIKLASKAGGGFKTVHDREVIASRLANHLQLNNIQIKDIEFLKSKHVETYIKTRLDVDGISKRTAQNELAGIRVTLRHVGHDKLADSDRLSNATLGVAGASREGTKTAMPNEMFRDRLPVIERKDKGVATCMMLERLLGLRGEEAVQSEKSLQTWATALEKGDTIRVVYGTKGARPQDTHVVHVERAREIIAIAIQRTKEAGGRLIRQTKPKNSYGLLQLRFKV